MSKTTSKPASAAASAAAAMTAPAQLERLGEHLRKLRLLKSGERLEALLQQAAANELSYAEFLEQVLGEEVAAKTIKNIAMRTAMARFPFVNRWRKAHAEGRLDDKMKVFNTPRLLIDDEIGYLTIDWVGANQFFQLIIRRYERGPMILTSNQSFGAWGEVSGDRVIATAILDRLLHHAVTMNIRGNSFRLKDKLKAGLVRSHEDNASQPGGEI